MIDAALVRMGLLAAGDSAAVSALEPEAGIERLRIELPAGPILIERALDPATVGNLVRHATWLRTVGEIAPDAAPALLGEDREAHVVATRLLADTDYPPWSRQIDEGQIEYNTSVEVAEALAAIHAGTAGDGAPADLANELTPPGRPQLSPALARVVSSYPDLKAPLLAQAEATLAIQRTLVHGNLSPQTILVGARSPVFTGAHNAWFGDPALDLASCLAHLLFEATCQPARYAACLSCFEALAETYIDGVAWEPPGDLAGRAARLLPALLLALLGTQPEPHATHVEGAVQALRDDVATLEEVRARWRDLVA